MIFVIVLKTNKLAKNHDECIFRQKQYYGLKDTLRRAATAATSAVRDRPTTPFPPQTSNRLRFRYTVMGCSVSMCIYKTGYVRLYSTFLRQRLDQ